MGKIDVTEVLTDPDFADEIELITRTPMVNSLGENYLKEDNRKTIGIVQPASGDTINKLPEAFRVEGVYSFWFKGAIIADRKGNYSSVLVFQNERYQVQHVANWSNWGAGWTEGTCVKEKPTV